MSIDYDQLRALGAILRTGSFEGAAAELGLTQPAVSQRLRSLEERVGTLLVNRGQPCTGTDAGRRLAAHLDHVGLLEAQLGDDLGALVPDRGTQLKIAVNADSLATWFLEAVAQVPDLLIDLVVDDQEFSVDWLRKGEVAAAITSHHKPIAGCDSTPLGSLRYVATASPDYMRRYFSRGVTPEALAVAPMLRFDPKDYLQTRWMQQTLGCRQTPPNHRIPSSQGFVEACLLGMGWGMNPEILVRAHIETGQLVPLVQNAPYDTPLYWQSSRLLKDALEPVRRAVRKTARLALPQN